MKQTKLKTIFYKNPPKPPIKESKMGDLYIEVGETIEEIEILIKKLNRFTGLYGKTSKSAIKQISDSINILKKVFDHSYDFKK